MSQAICRPTPRCATGCCSRLFGSPDNRQIDGIGGAHPLTSKVAIVSRSQRTDADVDYLFGQVVVDEARVDYSPTCGNILAGVAPFALESGLLPASADRRYARAHLDGHTDSLCEATSPRRTARVSYSGDARISGVPGTPAPILLAFRPAPRAASCGALFPTGHAQGIARGGPVTCIDNGMPVVIIEGAPSWRFRLRVPGRGSTPTLSSRHSSKRFGSRPVR